jgi:hypothetical protein
MIPLWLLILALLACGLLLVITLWRSEWLSRRNPTSKVLIVFVITVVYCAAATPPLLKLIHSEQQPLEATKPGTITTTGDCSPVVTGDKNTTNVPCEPKVSPKAAR